jgi:hypothetical protein
MFIAEQEKLNKRSNYIYMLVTEKTAQSPEFKMVADCFAIVQDAGLYTSRKSQLKQWERLKYLCFAFENSGTLYKYARKFKKLFCGNKPMNFCVQYYHDGIIGRRIEDQTLIKRGKYTFAFDDLIG